MLPETGPLSGAINSTQQQTHSPQSKATGTTYQRQKVQQQPASIKCACDILLNSKELSFSILNYETQIYTFGDRLGQRNVVIDFDSICEVVRQMEKTHEVASEALVKEMAIKVFLVKELKTN